MAHPIQGLIEESMKSIKEMIDVNTIIGEPVTTADGTTIIPVSKVSFGFGAGGGNVPSEKEQVSGENAPFGGGSGAGVSIKPVGFLVVGKDQIKMLPVEGVPATQIDKLFEYVPQIIDKVNGIVKEYTDKREDKNE